MRVLKVVLEEAHALDGVAQFTGEVLLHPQDRVVKVAWQQDAMNGLWLLVAWFLRPDGLSDAPETERSWTYTWTGVALPEDVSATTYRATLQDPCHPTLWGHVFLAEVA